MDTYQKIGLILNNRMHPSWRRIFLSGVICYISVLLSVSCAYESEAGKEAILPLQATSLPTQSVDLVSTPTYLPQSMITSTHTPMPTSLPISTLTPTATGLTEPSTGGIEIAIQLWNSVDGSSVEILDDNFELLYSFPGRYIQLSSFSADGCELIGINYNDDPGSFEIRILNLQGEELYSKTVILRDPEEITSIYQYLLSPTHHWLVYKRVDQFQMSAQEAAMQDVQLLKVEESNPQDTIQLTERGGAYPSDLVWSYDGVYLAYTDYDERGVQQIFLFNPEVGQKVQKTHFGLEMKDHKISQLKWSPNSQALVFLIVGIHETDTTYETTDQGAIGIVSINEIALKWLDFKGYPNYNLADVGGSTFAAIYWDNQGKMLLIPIKIKAGGSEEEALVWYDLEKGRVDHVIRAIDISGRLDFSFAFPLNDISQVGLWYSDEIYIYDRISQEISIQKHEYFPIENSTFLIAPTGPIDPIRCSQ